METKRRLIRIDDGDWERLKVAAQTVVHDSDMPNGYRPGDARVSILLQKIARGEIVCTRVGETS